MSGTTCKGSVARVDIILVASSPSSEESSISCVIVEPENSFEKY